jgi:hypothetical protein
MRLDHYGSCGAVFMFAPNLVGFLTTDPPVLAEITIYLLLDMLIDRFFALFFFRLTFLPDHYVK